VHGNLLDKVGQDKSQAFKISNALSPDLQYYRLSLTPSLLEKVHPNIKLGFSEFAIYEINKAHNKIMRDEQDKDLPKEFQMLSLVFASNDKKIKQDGAPFYWARTTLDYLAEQLGLELEYRPFAEEEKYSVVKPFDHTRSAQVWDRKTGMPLGMVGEYKQSVVKNLKLPNYSAGFEVDIEGLLKASKNHTSYQPLNRFPSLEQDFNLRTDSTKPYAGLTEFMTSQLEHAAKEHGYIYELQPLDVFQKEDDKDHKQTTWRIILSHPERTLTTNETNHLLDEIAKKASEELKAERI
jgi:phenylalanyl-tRNA synthetase beta chain